MESGKTIEISRQFRADPKRGVYVSGTVDSEMVARLTPVIMGLWSDSTEPLTVFINSHGGIIGNARMIEGMLKAPSPDGEERRVIGVGVGFALSAAADLLIGTDYAIAYPSCQIHCHGSRFQLDRPVTAEDAERYWQDLQVNNDERALHLAASTFKRVLFRYQYFKDEFDSVRGSPDGTPASDIQCFVRLIQGRLSPRAAELAGRALERQTEVKAMSEFAFGGGEPVDDIAAFEVHLLQRVAEYEVRRHTGIPGWTLSGGGFEEVSRDYKLLLDYHIGTHHGTLRDLAEMFRRYFIESSEEAAIRAKNISPAMIETEIGEAIRERMEPIWYFCLFLCRLLMERENPIFPLDAFWLGLIDEVAGDTTLPTLRKAFESAPPPQEELPLDEAGS